MLDFDYKYKNLPYRWVPWIRMRNEETSWVVLRAYRLNILTSDEIAPFVYKKILKSTSTVAFPFLSYYYFSTLYRKNSASYRMFSPSRLKFMTLLSVAATWVAFSYVNPFYWYMRAEKKKLLQYLDHNIAWNMLSLNNMLPYSMTESRVDRKILGLYAKRNSILTGVIFAPEFSGFDNVKDDALPADPNVFE